MELRYLIIYESNGLPIFSRCFSNICSRFMKEDVLLSAFLAAITHSIDAGLSFGDSIPFEGGVVKIHEVKGRLQSMEFEDLNMRFYYGNQGNYTIAAGLPLGQYDEKQMEQMVGFFRDIENLMQSDVYRTLDWSNQTTQLLLEFERDLYSNAIDNWFKKSDIHDNCQMGDKCLLRWSMLEFSQERTINLRIKAGYKKFKKENIFKKMLMMVFPTKFKRISSNH